LVKDFMKEKNVLKISVIFVDIIITTTFYKKITSFNFLSSTLRTLVKILLCFVFFYE